jgi:hypothetical protein
VIRDWNAEHDARATAAVEVIRKQMRRDRRQNVLHRAVFVDVAGDAERRERADLIRVRNRSAEHEDRQTAFVDPPDRPHDLDAACIRQPQIDQNKVDLLQISADPREQFDARLDRNRAVSRCEYGVGKTVAHERAVVGNDDGFLGSHGPCCIAEFIRISL